MSGEPHEHLPAKRQEHWRPVAGRITLRQAAANRADISNLGIADLAGCVVDDRESRAKLGTPLELPMSAE